jgi:hypothetical protein
MVKFMPDPLSRREFEALKRIGVLPAQIQARNRSEKRLILLGFAEEVLGILVLTEDGMMRIAMGR